MVFGSRHNRRGTVMKTKLDSLVKKSVNKEHTKYIVERREQPPVRLDRLKRIECRIMTAIVLLLGLIVLTKLFK